MLERTYAHSIMLGSPFRARHRANVKRAPAYAMDSVAEPAPALAFTTSVPASCVMQHLVKCNRSVPATVHYTAPVHFRIIKI
jgi:hypothetical protein